MNEIEIIIVDDGSSDRSGLICDNYAQQDGRIRVIHKSNEGLSAARNDGVRVSTAPFILFVDSDDWIAVDLCEKVYKVAIENDSDIVLFSFEKKDVLGKSIQMKPCFKTGTVTDAQAIHYNFSGWDAAWLALYRKELFCDIQYPVGKYYEDVGTSHRLIHLASKKYILNEVLYFHRVGRKGSITASSETRNHLDKREMFASKAMDLYSWGYKEYAQLYAMNLLIKYGWRRYEQKKMVCIVREIKGAAPKTFNAKKRMMLTVYRLSPTMFDVVCIILRKRIKWIKEEDE